MRKPEKIEYDIAQLEKELEKSKEFHNFILVCDSSTTNDVIGFFNMGNMRLILNMLHDGRHLQYRHAAFGKVDVWMNPQRNRILVSNDNDSFSEDNIIKFMCSGTGEWWIDNEKTSGKTI